MGGRSNDVFVKLKVYEALNGQQQSGVAKKKCIESYAVDGQKVIKPAMTTTILNCHAELRASAASSLHPRLRARPQVIRPAGI